MHCESPLLGMCTDHPRITCYSQHQIDVWNIGRLETHFAKISNPCIVKMQRLDATSHERVQYLASRILVVAKVRIIIVCLLCKIIAHMCYRNTMNLRVSFVYIIYNY